MLGQVSLCLGGCLHAAYGAARLALRPSGLLHPELTAASQGTLRAAASSLEMPEDAFQLRAQ